MTSDDWAAAAARLAPEKQTFRPVLYRFGEPALENLVTSGEVAFIHDDIERQLHELMEVHDPKRPLSRAELDERARRHVGGPFEAYGLWAWYPWSRRLVHILPKEEFVLLRLSANRNLITEAEQRRLSGLAIGVVGLSVGQMTAVTLAMEGVGGHLRLADFDTLGLANMNRIRAGVHQLEMNKAVLSAREIYEIDPYADVAMMPEGITEDNIDEFLDGLDLLFEECDSLDIKVLIRERARQRRIPVLMETSDRGLMDVERFDREPSRPLFHGLAGELRAADLKGLTTYQKVPIVYGIIGNTMSTRMAASLIDIETTLKTWPQIASAVALSAGINTDAARRIALGQFTESGRFFVDAERIVADGQGEPTPLPVPEETAATAPIPEPPPAFHPGAFQRLSEEAARVLIAYGTLAPSGGNCQPWHFTLTNGTLRCRHAASRSRSLLDVDDCASYLALGALARNIELAATALGCEARVHPFPEGGDVFHVELAPSPGISKHVLVDSIVHRTTNRKLATRVPLRSAHRSAMTEAALRAGASLEWLEGDEELSMVAGVLAEGDRIRALSPVLHREMMSEIRWTDEEARRTRDGLSLATLELTPTDRIGMRLLADPAIMSLLREMNAGHGLGRGTLKAIGGSSAVGLLSISGTTPSAYFHGGRALQEVWLTASQQGLAFQPMTALLYLFARLSRRGGEGFSPTEGKSLTELLVRFRGLFQTAPNRAELMLFRVAYADPPSARSLRRRVDDVFSVT